MLKQTFKLPLIKPLMNYIKPMALSNMSTKLFTSKIDKPSSLNIIEEIDQNDNKQSMMKAIEAIEETAKNHPNILEKIIEGVKHVKHGFSMTFNDAVYWSKLLKIENKTISEIRD